MSYNDSLPSTRNQPIVDQCPDWYEAGELAATLGSIDLSKPPPSSAAQTSRSITPLQINGNRTTVGIRFPPPTNVICEDVIGCPSRPPEQHGVIRHLLKRPSASNSVVKTVLQKPKLEQKSLRQREQEYAEARQRILGEAESTTENVNTTVGGSVPPRIQPPPPTTTNKPATNRGRGGGGGGGGVPPRLEMLCPLPSVPPPPLQVPRGGGGGRGVTAYSAQRQFRAPPPLHIQHCGPPPPLEAARYLPRCPEGNKGYSGKR